MNTQLDELLKKAQYYTPSKTVDLDASGGANDEITIEFTGLNTNRYGVNRFLAGGTGLNEVIATAAFNNGRDKKFENVHLSCLNQLFKNRSLRGAFVIGDATKMYLTLKNTGAGANSVNVELIGYDSAHLQEKMDQYEQRQTPFPQPEFVYLEDTTIAAGATAQRYQIALPAYKLRLYRLAFATDDVGNNLQISIRQGQTRIKPEVYLSQLNDEFISMDIILPQTLEANTPFDLFVTNADGANPYQLSMLAECYKI